MEHSANKRSNANGDCSSFLWNQLVSGAPVVLGLDAYRPPAVRIKEQVLNAAFRTALEKRAEQSVLSSLTGTVQFSVENDGIVIILDQVPGCTPSPLRPNGIQVPCKFDKFVQGSGATNSSKEEWLAKLTTFEDAWDYASLECGLGFSLAVTADLAARVKGPSCDLTVTAVTPVLPLRLVPLFPIPVLRSGVQDTLSSPHASAPDFGFVTLCGDRLCFHFKHQLEDGGLNFIGVWISGVASVEHPFIWLVCAQFVTSQRLASRPKDIFVVCILSRLATTAGNVSFGKPPEEVLFYNCLCQSHAGLHFQLWQGEAVTSVARVPSASNKTISVNLGKVLSGSAAETFHSAQKELVKNRVPLVATPEQNNSATTQDSWVPTPRPARSQNINLAPTVPDVSDLSMGLSAHSRPENASYGTHAVAVTCSPRTDFLNTGSQGGCFTQRYDAVRVTQDPVTPAHGGPSTPLQSCGVQDCNIAVTDAQFRLPQQQQCAPSVPTAEHHAETEPVPAGVYELIRRQDEQLLELRLHIQRLLCASQERNKSGPPVLSHRPAAGESARNDEKLTRNAATMTDAKAQLVHRSVQTDKTTTDSSGEKGCSYCGRRKQEQPASEIPERDTDYTIFFPEKSPHLVQKLTHKPGPRTAATMSHREPAECPPRPAFAHSKTSDLLQTPNVSFRDDLSLLPGRLEGRDASQTAVPSSSTGTFIHPRLQYEESQLGGQRRDELSFQVDRIAHKYCPDGAGPSASPLAKGGVPLSQDAQAYLRNYGLDSRRASGNPVGGTDSMERILDISALRRLPKLL